MTRRGVTLVELLFALALAAAMVVAYYTVCSGGTREGLHVERGAELMGSATVLQEVLSWDLLRSLPADAPAGPPAASLELPLLAGYDARETPSPAFHSIEYRFDPGRGVLLRDGQVLLSEGLESVTFRWMRGSPDLLEVALAGKAPFGVHGPRFVIRLPAPTTGHALGSWRFAAHHRSAREKGDLSGRGEVLAYQRGGP